MLIGNGDGTYSMGEWDVACVYQMGTRFHAAFFEEQPLPGGKTPEEQGVVRLKSKFHHTEGYDTFDAAVAALRTELLPKIRVPERNVYVDKPIPVEDPVQVWMLRPWNESVAEVLR